MSTIDNPHHFPFSDRLTWLAWRADWRLRYAAASEAVRAEKRVIAGLRADWRTTTDEQERTRIGYRADVLQSYLLRTRDHANDLMLERTAANEYKAKQLAARSEALAA